MIGSVQKVKARYNNVRLSVQLCNLYSMSLLSQLAKNPAQPY